MITRRQFAAATGVAIAAGWSGAASAAGDAPARLSDDLARIAAQSGGRLGVAVIDTAGTWRVGHDADSRFPLCSTFKLLACAAVLAGVDVGQERLDRRIRFEAGDLVDYSPRTQQHVGGPGMAIEELCEAAMTLSDNTAANLLLAALGGPPAVTAFARRLGDDVTRLDRIEPGLNEAVPGDPRDTTSPAAMAANLRVLLLGEVLSQSSRRRLTDWLVGNRTGDARLRAGVPSLWRVGDKTGSGERGTANDVAVVWPPQRAPVIIAAFLTETIAAPEHRNATHAAVGRAVVAAIGGNEIP